MAVIRGALVGFLLIASLSSVVYSAGPLHASCKLTWDFSKVPCSTVHKLIVMQMQVWNESAPCRSSEKCHYKITSNTTTEIKGTHTTPVHMYVDDLTMTFSSGPSSSSSSCTVAGNSRSEIFYAVLDKGTNYCNLHNLVVGSGLTNTTRYGYEETTSNSVCTEYSSADCSKY